MNTVVRVIGKNGNGMYRSEVGDHFHRHMYGNEEHPPPRKDYLLRTNARHLFAKSCFVWDDEDNDEADKWNFVGGEFVFGFKNYAQFRAWMNNVDVLAELSLLGHKVVIMQGECYYGHTQAVIRKSSAKIIRCLTFEEYLAENGEPNLI